MCVFYNSHSDLSLWIGRQYLPWSEVLTLTLLLHQPQVTSSSRGSGWDFCLLPADATPLTYTSTYKPASFLLRFPSDLQVSQSILTLDLMISKGFFLKMVLKPRTKQVLWRPGGPIVCPWVVREFHGQQRVRIPLTFLLEAPLWQSQILS